MVKTAWKLTKQERDQVRETCGSSGPISKAYELVQGFLEVMRGKGADGLDGWLREASESGAAEMARFAEGIVADRRAVEAGLTSHFSNGQTEGQMNRLKLVKRSMYGRGKLDLLRTRLTHAA